MRTILASASPRRVELLRQFGFEFTAIPSDIPENQRSSETPIQIVMGLALEKALSIAEKHPDDLIIASDTIVFQETVLGKPIHREDAKRMLMALSGKRHDVYTGLALVRASQQKRYIDYEKTTVVFNSLTEKEIDAYLDTGEAFDKAGAYGIQGFGALLVKRIEGDFYNVMGLPLSKLNAMLKLYFDMDLLF